LGALTERVRAALASSNWVQSISTQASMIESSEREA
jgi:hypothetical protein